VDNRKPVSADIVHSDKSRVTSPVVSQADMTSLVDGNNSFAFNLYQELKGSEGNMFFSPYSISLALAMTYAGARDSTAQQMAGTLHYILPQDSLHPLLIIWMKCWLHAARELKAKMEKDSGLT